MTETAAFDILLCMKLVKDSERLDKVLSNNGFGTRKEVRHFIRSKVVTVNGQTVIDPDAQVLVDTDVIAINGEKINIKRNLYLMMNKSANHVCSTTGGLHPTVFDLLDPEEHTKFLGGELHTVGRLDVDTEGLLILTTDGALTHRLTSPKWHCSKTYLVYLRDKVSSEDRASYAKQLAAGVHIAKDDNDPESDCLPAEIEWKDEAKYESVTLTTIGYEQAGANAAQSPATIIAPNAVCHLTVYEGKYHEVKRLFAALGNEVTYLKRVSINDLSLDASIPLGKYRELTEAEVKLLDVKA
jgi:16S rRNA pseudouridine516 synthase